MPSRQVLNPGDDGGRRLKNIRDGLGLRYRDVEQASYSIAQRHGSDEFAIALSRLADIENKGTVPTIFRLYSLCAIYRLDIAEVMGWYGIDFGRLVADSALVELAKTHTVKFKPNRVVSVRVPLAVDPGLDFSRTSHLSRLIQKWGSIPLMLLSGIDKMNHRYAFVGTEDYWLHPLIPPGSLLLLDDSKRKPLEGPLRSETERPVYFFEHRDGFIASWCNLVGSELILSPHPATGLAPRVFEFPAEIDVLGQVIGVAMRLDRPPRRRTRSATTPEEFPSR